MRATPIQDAAIVVDAQRDNVAVAKTPLACGAVLATAQGQSLVLEAAIELGHRFALCAIPAGGDVVQYGQPFARSRGLRAGDPITGLTTDTLIPEVDPRSIQSNPTELPAWDGPMPTFDGFVRADGRVGVRNWVLVVPTSMCSSHEAVAISQRAEASGLWSRQAWPNVDGVTAIPHTRGCGCPDFDPGGGGARTTSVVEASLRMIGRYIEHPNVGAVLVIELGCEKTHAQAVGQYVARLNVRDTAGGSSCNGAEQLAEFGRRHGKMVATLSVQQCGGTAAAVRRGLEVLPMLLEQANRSVRQRCGADALCLGLKCGGSDAFSGLSANPALGEASDLLLRAGGTSVITEVTEFFGAEHLFAARARSPEVASEVLAAMERFRRYVARVDGTMADNPSPGNRAGGLLNITIKSLGAVAKAGRAPVEGVLDYGERPRGRGLWMLYCPSYDQESTPALVGSGCQVVCFTTGRGTGIGNAIAPVIKISSTSALARRMAGDIDFDAGPVLDGHAIEEVGRTLFHAILRVASGQAVKAELNGHREFMIWSEEGVSL